MSLFYSGILLLIIYAAFCDTFSQEDLDVDASSLLSVVILSKYILTEWIHLTRRYFMKGNNCHDFLFAFLNTRPCYKWQQLWVLRMCSSEANSFLSVKILLTREEKGFDSYLPHRSNHLPSGYCHPRGLSRILKSGIQDTTFVKSWSSIPKHWILWHF